MLQYYWNNLQQKWFKSQDLGSDVREMKRSIKYEAEIAQNATSHISRERLHAGFWLVDSFRRFLIPVCIDFTSVHSWVGSLQRVSRKDWGCHENAARDRQNEPSVSSSGATRGACYGKFSPEDIDKFIDLPQSNFSVWICENDYKDSVMLGPESVTPGL